ncbi:hypothetical protein ACQP00_33590 [Dactylosporangium sp. CS-047395]|uniref:hypothetical protein n=1 Tax=Dactylosporangium sp. CS-047395 TaxID=3239936 RepID=UPI003D8A91E3
MAIDAPLRQLAHRTGSGETTGGSWNTYALHPIPAERPPAGRTVATMTCPECGRPVRFAIAGPDGLRRRRLGWQIAAAGPVALIPVLFLPALAARTPAQAVALTLLGVALLPVLGFAIHWALQNARAEDGLRLLRDDGIHTLRKAGATSDFNAAMEA